MNDFLTFIAKNATSQDEATLREANKLLNHAFKMKSTQKAVEFYIGQKVSFPAKGSGIHVQGRVLKVNRLSVKVQTLNGQLWNVSPGLLTPM